MEAVSNPHFSNTAWTVHQSPVLAPQGHQPFSLYEMKNPAARPQGIFDM
jgi:hypothetical protein